MYTVTLIVTSTDAHPKITQLEVPKKNFGEMIRQMVGHAVTVSVLEPVPQKVR